MKILVTGGAGFIGSHVCENLLLKGHEVIVLDDFSTGARSNLDPGNDQLTVYEGRVEEFDFDQVQGVQSVIHLAAQASVPLSISDFYLSSKTNVLSSLKIIDFCIKNKVPLVYASSSAVYGGLAVGDDESSRIDLLSPYAADKFSLELYCQVAKSTADLSSIGLRFFNVYGPRQDPTNPYSGVISIFIDRLGANKTIVVNGGAQTRDFIFVKDVAEVVVRAVDLTTNSRVSDFVNVLTGVSVSVDYLADLIIEITGSTADKIYGELQPGDPLESNGTTSKLARLLRLDSSGFVSLKDGLSATVNYIKYRS